VTGCLNLLFKLQEELLAYVLQYHSHLDSINLVTCVYRLARMFSFIRSPESRSMWRQELITSPAFHLLLGDIYFCFSQICLALQFLMHS